MGEGVRAEVWRKQRTWEDADMKNLSRPSKLVIKLYSRMEAYENHFLIAYIPIAFSHIGFRIQK
jgi:hypothetical protein